MCQLSPVRALWLSSLEFVAQSQTDWSGLLRALIPTDRAAEQMRTRSPGRQRAKHPQVLFGSLVP